MAKMGSKNVVHVLLHYRLTLYIHLLIWGEINLGNACILSFPASSVAAITSTREKDTKNAAHQAGAWGN